MDFKQLKIMDFSQGIKSSEVMNNDLALQEQIQRERLAIAGSGINYGLNVELFDDFKVKVNKGTVIDKDGVERFIDEKIINIEKPILTVITERVYSFDDGVIQLKDIPYSDTRNEPSEYAQKQDIGITAYYEDDPSSDIYISKVSNNLLYTNARYTNKPIIVTYNVTYDRIDTIYINNDDVIKTTSSISSTTPSKTLAKDCKHILGFVRVTPYYYNEERDTKHAACSLIEDFDCRRTIYTDSKNALYLCGIPFESLLQIYLTEPKDTKEGMIWYDMETNKLKIWRRTDKFIFSDIVTYTSIQPDNEQRFKTSVGYFKDQLTVYRYNSEQNRWIRFRNEQIEFYTDIKESEKNVIESKEFRIVPKLMPGEKIRYTINRYDGSYSWIPINDTSFVEMCEYKMWAPSIDNSTLVHYIPGLNIDEMVYDRENHDLKHFIFDKEELNLRFTPYKNELSIMVDQIPLHRDQFLEITAEDILNDHNLLEISYQHGFTREILQSIYESNSELGLGFKFVNPLDKPAFIEVNVHHRVNDSTVKNKIQRNATFAKTGSIIYEPTIDTMNDEELIINTESVYQLGEEQLEVFVDGLRINKNHIREISTNDGVMGSYCKSFAINIEGAKIKFGSEIIYKTLTNIYSYDHVASAIEESYKPFEDKIYELEQEILLLKEQLSNITSN